MGPFIFLKGELKIICRDKLNKPMRFALKKEQICYVITNSHFKNRWKRLVDKKVNVVGIIHLSDPGPDGLLIYSMHETLSEATEATEAKREKVYQGPLSPRPHEGPWPSLDQGPSV